MTDWPDDYGGVGIGTDVYAISLETLETVRRALQNRDDWVVFDTLYGAAIVVRCLRIDATYVNTREARRRQTEHRQLVDKQLKEDVPEWEDAG